MISEFIVHAMLDASLRGLADETTTTSRRFVSVLAVTEVVGFYELEKKALFQELSGRELPGRNMLEFTIKASQRKSSIRRGILHAGGLSLILMAFTSRDFRPESLVNGDHVLPNKAGQTYPVTAPIPIQVINDEAATLTVLIHDIHFRSTWADRPFRLRRALCSQLLHELMGAAFDDRHTWTRALFLKILA
ncbi:hypothetical protein FIBSPDRAFT_133456 [Athelia psychrophila]|uniref:Uncharacterized protein n=1 Tax=Athelia psychrophila TaxID=1759441 RepID=A0A166CAZ9_9AGAM|nr:hypothetical protein FIBSPDRAFT_133456 [Fibularhizoctonia sp. CBS 109695]